MSVQQATRKRRRYCSLFKPFDLELFDWGEVFDVTGEQREVVFNRGGGNQRIGGLQPVGERERINEDHRPF